MDDQLMEEVRGTAPSTSVVRRFEGWRWQQAGNVTTEQVLPMLRLSGPLATVVATEQDGHAVLTWTWNSATGLIAAESTDLVGANGLDLADRSSQTPVGTPAWPLDGLHGAEADASEELLHFGARHMAMRDGLWLQPEPLLYLGPTNGDLRNPLGFGPLYAMGNTNAWADRTGYVLNVTGDTAGFESETEIALGGSVDVSISNSGDVSLTGLKGFNPDNLSVAQRGLYDTLTTVVGQASTTHIEAVKDVIGVHIGRCVGSPGNPTGPHEIDVGDIAQLGPQQPLSSAMALTHEIAEANLMEVSGVSYGPAHAAAEQLVTARTGWSRSAFNRVYDRNTNSVIETFGFARGSDSATVVLQQFAGQPIQVTR